MIRRKRPVSELMLSLFCLLFSLCFQGTSAAYKDLFSTNFQSINDSNLTNVLLHEDFNSTWSRRWITSRVQMIENSQQVLKYKGKWAVEVSFLANKLEKEDGLVAKTKSARHAISSKLLQFYHFNTTTLTLQYEVRFQSMPGCEGGYIKLISSGLRNLKSFGDSTPYSIMFGPDVCNSVNKIHFIVRYTSPCTGEIIEMQLKGLFFEFSTHTNLYTLIIREGQTFEILLNLKKIAHGSMFTSLTRVPPLKHGTPPDFVLEHGSKNRYIVNNGCKSTGIQPINNRWTMPIEPAVAVGFEIWAVNDGVLFDNILIAQDESPAIQMSQRAWTFKLFYEAKILAEDAGLGSVILSWLHYFIEDDEKAFTPSMSKEYRSIFLLNAFVGACFGAFIFAAVMLIVITCMPHLNEWVTDFFNPKDGQNGPLIRSHGYSDKSNNEIRVPDNTEYPTWQVQPKKKPKDPLFCVELSLIDSIHTTIDSDSEMQEKQQPKEQTFHPVWSGGRRRPIRRKDY